MSIGFDAAALAVPAIPLLVSVRPSIVMARRCAGCALGAASVLFLVLLLLLLLLAPLAPLSDPAEGAPFEEEVALAKGYGCEGGTGREVELLFPCANCALEVAVALVLAAASPLDSWRKRCSPLTPVAAR